MDKVTIPVIFRYSNLEIVLAPIAPETTPSECGIAARMLVHQLFRSAPSLVWTAIKDEMARLDGE